MAMSMKTEREIEAVAHAALRADGAIDDAKIESPSWVPIDDGDSEEWESHIPPYLRELWSDLPRYVKLIAYDLAVRKAAYIEWQNDEATLDWD